MVDAPELFLLRAEESLAGAESEFANGRYNNCANRCYYACFHAAIGALMRSGIQSTSTHGQWGHDFVQAEFVGQLVQRRKLYSSDLRDVLARTLSLRLEADYGLGGVGEMSTGRVLRRSRQFVDIVLSRERGTQ